MIEMVIANMKLKHHDFQTKWKTRTKTSKHQNALTYRCRWGRSKAPDFQTRFNRLGFQSIDPNC